MRHYLRAAEMINSAAEIIENCLKCDGADKRTFNCNYFAIMEIKFAVTPHANTIVTLSNCIKRGVNA